MPNVSLMRKLVDIMRIGYNEEDWGLRTNKHYGSSLL